MERGTTEELALEVGSIGSIDKRDGQNWTLLMWAASYNRDDLIRWLRANGADTELRDETGARAFEIAREHENSDAEQALIEERR